MKAFWDAVAPYLVAALVSYLLLVLSKLPPPENPTLRVFWRAFVRMSFLTWDAWGGKLKLPGVIEPPEPPEKEDTK